MRFLIRKMHFSVSFNLTMDYNLTICQANGRPIMTEHLNKLFKEILMEMNDPDMDPQEIVFHSLRHHQKWAGLFEHPTI